MPAERGVAEPDKIAFRELRLDDLATIHRWLNAEHVRRWYSFTPVSYEAVVAKYGPRIRGEAPTRPYLILYDGAPIGYIQTYRLADWPAYSTPLEIDEPAAGLDLYIGEPAYLGRGLAAPLIRRFLAEIVFAAADVVSCIVDPDPANTVALRAYARAGFRYLKTVAVPGQAQPEYLLRIGRADLAAAPAAEPRG